jgi:beta-mannosidase
MKNIFAGILMLSAFTTISQEKALNWQLQHATSKDWINAGTHGSVQEILIDKGELPDPFFGKNEEKFGWIEDHTWEFSSVLNAEDDLLNNDHIELLFPGIDTYAEIFLNDSLIGFAQNAFRPYRFEIKSLLRRGENKLKVIFYPPVIYHKERYQKESYHLPAPNDLHPIAVAPYTRKPQYQFGWDWALRMNTLGFLKPVTFKGYNNTTVLTKNISVKEIHTDYAVMSFELNLSDPPQDSLFWESKLFGSTSFSRGEQTLWREETIKDHELWWPRGQGEQFLYDDEWIVKDKKGNILYSKKVRFGIKHSELINQADKWGTSYEIKINGRPVFCKGADYIPQDIFPSRMKDSDLRKMVEIMAESNFNMVRVWGGGYYPDDAFFDACDELGVMVWQDFMFACSMYPGDPEFLQNVGEEVAYQIPRIASHPSVTIFNGNNEVDVAWKNWGFQVRYNIYGKDAKEVEESYDRLFKNLLPNKVREYTNLPYIHTSPLSNWGKDEYYNHGSQHYWGVWHGKDPMEDFGKKIGRFNAEYGFQSFPEYATLKSFSTKEDWDVQSEVMKHHQKSYVGNLMILKHAKNLYGMPETFEDFVYYSQLTQGHAVSLAVTGHRLDAPRCMGTLYWQLNDCWPAPTWSSIDHYWNWKALNYWIKDDYEDVAVLRKSLGEHKYEYYLVADIPDTFMCEMNFTVFDLKGKELFQNNVSQLVKGVESSKICMKSLDNNFADQNVVVRFDWKDRYGNRKTRTFSQLPSVYTKANLKDIEISIEQIDTASKTMTLIVETKNYLRNFWLYSELKGLKFDRNFVDLIPGKHRFEIIYLDEIPKIEGFSSKWL